MSDSALAAVTAAFEAIDRRDWQALFNVLDPSGIERFKAQQRRWLSIRERGAFFARRSKSNGLLKHVFAVDSLEAYDALPAALVLRRWLVVSHGRFRKDEKPERRRKMLGEVYEGADVAHVVFRESFNEEDRVRVISARRTANGWRVALGGGLVVDESGSASIGYDPSAVDPTEGESGFIAPSP